MNASSQHAFIAGLPKVELHLHLEGTLEPELMFALAERNQISIPYKTTDEIRAAYKFHNLQSFLDIYYQGAGVLITEQDFFDLTWAYLEHCKQDNVIHTEVFFDPQTHTDRGISFDTVIQGIHRALEQGREELGITSKIIMCFLRHLDEDSAIETLNQALPYKDWIIGVGLDSTEIGNPPHKHEKVFAMAREHGFLTVSHAGEEGPAQNIIDTLEVLKTSRIDHGVRCADDEQLVNQLAEDRTPLTVCPLSNTALKVFEEMEEHNIVELLRKGLCVTINSDDPAYFGGYMNDNFNAVADAHAMTEQEIAQFTFNAIEASFITTAERERLRKITQDYLDSFKA
ncbi:adenosine deaminase [Parendozoicomonas haliclonae]|uniref:Adenine deaminase n=1 Tax=Parendozoicomonas haliclonae TaxID=1960125 RepID=A0A1X7AJ79_9GAMM|nr:adenosine deaminase [Parendozoicomonas haliclonae]SMA40474.1 Adenine deaminase [Parendozoicomonas haliclonae]